jgi:hypothetical protein
MNTILKELSIADLRQQLITDTRTLLQILEGNISTGDLKDTFQKIKGTMEILIRKEEAAFYNINMELAIPGMDYYFLD